LTENKTDVDNGSLFSAKQSDDYQMRACWTSYIPTVRSWVFTRATLC